MRQRRSLRNGINWLTINLYEVLYRFSAMQVSILDRIATDQKNASDKSLLSRKKGTSAEFWTVQLIEL